MSSFPQPMVTVHGKSLPPPRLHVITRRGDNPPPPPLPFLRSLLTGGDSPLLPPCPLSVSPSVCPRLRIFPLPLPHANPLTTLGKKHHRGDRLSRHTAAHGRSIGRPLPGVPRPVSSAVPFLALRCPPHAAGHHLDSLALSRPPHVVGHHLERSDIQNNRALPPVRLPMRHGATTKLARGTMTMYGLRENGDVCDRRRRTVDEVRSWCRDILGDVRIATVRRMATVLRAGVQPCRHLFFEHRN